MKMKLALIGTRFFMLVACGVISLTGFRFLAVLLQSVHGNPDGLRGELASLAAATIVVFILGFSAAAYILRYLTPLVTKLAAVCFTIAVATGVSRLAVDASTLEKIWIGRCQCGDGDACGSLACLYSNPRVELRSSVLAAHYFERGCSLGDRQSCARTCLPRP